MTSISATPAASIAALGGAFLLLVACLTVWRHRWQPEQERVRKGLHMGSGLLTLPFPYVFVDCWPVVLLCGMAGMVLIGMRWMPVIRRVIGRGPADVDRFTLGELYFPVAVALVFWLAQGRHHLYFVIPMLVLTCADTAAALVGSRFGRHRYRCGGKSLEGSAAFAATAFVCVHGPVWLWAPVSREASFLLAGTVSLALTLLEAAAWRGLDNLFIPLGAYVLLSALVPLDVTASSGGWR